MKVIRKPRLTEVIEIKRLLDKEAETGSLLRRPIMELYENVRDFYVYADENGLGGCCALHIDTEDLAEIRSLMVRSDLRGTGVGRNLLEACLQEAQGLNIGRVYALTRVPVFFASQGFTEIDMHQLPHKVFQDCVRCPLFPDCDEVAMIRALPQQKEQESAPERKSNMALQGNLGFLGYGNMGSAIACGLVRTGVLKASQVSIAELDAAKCAEASAKGFTVAADPADLASTCSTLILAVKPQTMEEALAQLKPGLNADTFVISIAAGISISYLRDRLGADARVARVMPNTPALAGCGAAGIALADNCTEADAAAVKTIFDAVGISEMVAESDIDAVTALSGSGPAYFFQMVECLVEAAKAHGMDEAVATRLAAQTVLGAGKLMMESGESPATLRERVTSKGGTTFAALEQFRASDLSGVVRAAFDAAAARSKELGR
jgi:pyrroline-5-carboxylate reductase